VESFCVFPAAVGRGNPQERHSATSGMQKCANDLANCGRRKKLENFGGALIAHECDGLSRASTTATTMMSHSRRVKSISYSSVALLMTFFLSFSRLTSQRCMSYTCTKQTKPNQSDIQDSRKSFDTFTCTTADCVLFSSLLIFYVPQKKEKKKRNKIGFERGTTELKSNRSRKSRTTTTPTAAPTSKTID
jgi:hypothetical protein